MAFGPEDIEQPAAKRPGEPALSAEPTSQAKQTIAEAQIYRRGVVTLRDIIAPTALAVESSFIRLNDKFARTIFITEYPRYISVGWFAPIINFSATMDIAMHIYPVRADIILKQLRNKVGALEAEIISDHEKGAPPCRNLSQGACKAKEFAVGKVLLTQLHHIHARFDSRRDHLRQGAHRKRLSSKKVKPRLG